jgi:hypothetical protein
LPVTFEKLLQTDTGARGWIFSTYCHVRDNMYSFTAQEVTDKKILEEELQRGKLQLEETVIERTKELQEALEVKSRFLGNVTRVSLVNSCSDYESRD